MRGVGNLSGLTKEEMFSDVANIESLADKLEVPEEVLALVEEFGTRTSLVTDSQTHLLQN